MMSKWALILVAVLVIVVVLSAAIAMAGLYGDNPIVTKPFAFNLSTNPNNGTVIQGQNITIGVNAAYLEGQPEPITLSASGGPNGTLYQFSNQTGTPTQTQPFTSNLTILLPQSEVSGVYLIDITSNASTQTSHTQFNLTITKPEIKVYRNGIDIYGNVTINSKTTIGDPLDIIPTDILFTSTTTGRIFQTKINRFTDTDLGPGKTGSYSIQLANRQSYRVEFYCFSYPHYIPVLRIPISPNGTSFIVDCGANEKSLVANFIG
jgi:hypothetical protein